jgi:AcrR family transcriptional regulator
VQAMSQWRAALRGRGCVEPEVGAASDRACKSLVGDSILSPTSDPRPELPRDRFATRAAIVESAAAIIASQGLQALGVNSLAHEAKCDKVLIYRYFGGLDGVLAALGAERMLWPRIEIATGEEDGDAPLADAIYALLLEEWAALSGSPLMLEASAAELASDPNSLGTATSTQRAELHARLISKLREEHRIPPYVDLPALVELLSAALTLLALRSAHATRHADMDSPQSFDWRTPQGWRRIEKMVGTITRALLSVDS